MKSKLYSKADKAVKQDYIFKFVKYSDAGEFKKSKYHFNFS